MKKIILITLSLLISMSVFSEEKEKRNYEVKKGDWSIGFAVSPQFGGGVSLLPKAGSFTGATIEENAKNPNEMFYLPVNPMAAFRFKYQLSEKSAFRINLGFNGNITRYREYVPDDYALALDPDSQKQVTDVIKSNLHGASLGLGWEFKAGKRAIKFVGAFGLIYTVGGGTLGFNYGNQMTDLNHKPTSLPMTQMSTADNQTINEFKSVYGMEFARPKEMHNVGYIHSFGIQLDMGLEFFLAERISLGAAVTFIPVAYSLQPQTYTVYEGFSTVTGQVEKFNGLVSPGSRSFTYGTDNIGLSISLCYYL